MRSECNAERSGVTPHTIRSGIKIGTLDKDVDLANCHINALAVQVVKAFMESAIKGLEGKK